MTKKTAKAPAKAKSASDGKFFKVSQSKVRTWRSCRRAYHNKYVLKLKRKTIKRPFMFGRVIHSMVEAEANGMDPFKILDQIELTNRNLFAKERELYGDLIEDARLIMEEYFDYWSDSKDKVVYLKRDGKGAEHSFEMEIAPGILLTGKIDAVGKAKKMQWLVENKTFKRMPSDDERWRSVQSAAYIRSMEMLGWWRVDGTMWDYIKSKSPSTPAVLKSGEVSQAACDTLPSRVQAFLKVQGKKPSQYKDLMEKAEHNRTNYFIRIFNPMKKKVVDAAWADLIETAQEMAELHGKVAARTVGRHCAWCDFEALCRGEMQGLDVDFIKQREYTTNEEDYEEPDVSQED